MISTFALLMAAAAAAPAATPAATAAPAKPLTLQEQYDTASSFAHAGRCGEALPAFDVLEANPAYKAGSLSAAMVAVLKGQCLIRAGRTDEGEASIRKGLPRLQARGAQFGTDIASAQISLGDAALLRSDYSEARRAYEIARAIPNGTHPVTINLKLAQATAFDGGEAPLSYINAAIEGAKATPDLSKEKLAEIRTIRGRILLNQGRFAEAYAELQEALKLTGRLDLRVTRSDVVMRSDLALAAKLSGDNSAARKYLAYTGAGRIEEGPFRPGMSMQPPVCGAETGLKPDDFAVVDFAIGADGEVIYAQTVYSPGSSEVAAQFAQAVSKWAWDPETIKKIPAFFLSTSRVEVRCTTMAQQAPGLMAPLMSRFVNWSTAQLQLKGSTEDETLKQALDKLAPDNDPVRTAARFGLQGALLTRNETERYELLKTALAANGAPNAVPAEARNALQIIMMLIRMRTDGKNRAIEPARRSHMLALAESPDFASDALAADTARLLYVEPNSSRKERRAENAIDILQKVATDARLAETHPLRQVAHLQLADLAARKDDFTTAQAHFKATGLSEEQCTLLGVKPALKTSGISGDDFPREALEWGFGGWVQLEFDITNNGKATTTRPLIAYPPFIFSSAAARSAQDFSFQSSFRPSGGAACTAQRQTLSYVKPW